jgi:hypothetical protein
LGRSVPLAIAAAREAHARRPVGSFHAIHRVVAGSGVHVLSRARQDGRG